MSLAVTFQGGTNTIGGNAVVLKVKSENKVFRYLFDFGVTMEKYRLHKTLNSKPESIEDFQRRGLIPDFNMKFRACFLSHAHPDHYIVLPALYHSKSRPNAIWATRTTSRLIKSVQFVAKPLHLDPFRIGDYYEDSISRGLNVKVALYPVDHDIPGACCFFVIVDGSLVVYTGDFRDHGFLSATLKRQFWHYAKQLQSKNRFRSRTVICEGTNFGLPFDFRPQRDFDERVRDILSHYTKDIVALIINQDGLWDLFSTLQIAKKSKAGRSRKIVLAKSLSSFLDKIRREFLGDYKRVVAKENLDLFQVMMNYRRFLTYDARKDTSIELLREISRNPANYLLFLTRNEAFRALERIAMFSKNVGGCCILSFSASQGPSDSVTRTFAENIGQLGFCVERTNALARGHVSPHKLVDILNFIQPTKVFVMHTLAPEGLKAFLDAHLNCEIIAPSEGVSYEL